MIDSILSTYNVSEQLFSNFVKFMFIYSDKNCALSSDLLKNYLDKYIVEDVNKVEPDFSWDEFFAYSYQFRCNIDKYKNVISHHIVFPYNRKLVYDLIKFILSQKNLSTRIQQVYLYIKNNPQFVENEKFVEYVTNLAKSVVSDIKEKNPIFDLNDINSLFVFFKQLYICYHLLYMNTKIVSSFNDVLMTPEKSLDLFDTVIDELNNVKLKNIHRYDFDEICIDSKNLDDNIELIEYPIYPIGIFNKQKLFQKKRIYMFVGPSGIGKSMLLSNIAGEYLVDYKEHHTKEMELIFYFTFENLVEETAARIFSNAYYRLGCMNTIDNVLKRDVDPVDREIMRKRLEEIGRKLIITYLNPGLYGTNTLRGIISDRMEKFNGVPFVILVDFVDKMRSDSQVQNSVEHLELGKIIDELKSMASDLDCPVITVSHLNSEGCKIAREDIRKLNASNVGKSLRKYENSDVVVFMDVEESGIDEFNLMNFYFAKHRYARIDSPVVQKKFLPQYAYIGNITSEDRKLLENAEDGHEALDFSVSDF